MNSTGYKHLPDCLSRRDLLQVGGLGLTGVSLPGFLAARETTRARGGKTRADACILIHLNGGPPHLDMWDPKPDAPEAIRGEFGTIASSLPGYRVGSLMPKLARHMHRATVVRSMHHSVNNAHAAAVYCSLTGHDRGELGGGAKQTDHPSPGSILTALRPPRKIVVPHVTLPYMTQEGRGGPPQPGFFGGFLGRSHDPLFVLRDPNSSEFAVPELTLRTGVSAQRLSVRRRLFEDLNRRTELAVDNRGPRAMNSFQTRALDLLTSEGTQGAFRINEETASTRDAYGRNIYGQSTLLARRLIEAGTRLVTIAWAPDANATWDTHTNNFGKLKNTLLPQFDAAASSLIDDLARRGLLERTVVGIFGDFGRTPKINPKAGRDHWNFCYSLMMVGGGFGEGLVYGRSDAIGGFPAADPLVPGDIISTLFDCLGVSHDGEIHDQLERPYRVVPTGDIQPQLLG